MEDDSGMMNGMGDPARKIAFVGSRKFADFYGLGGMQSYIRRLGVELAGRGHGVDYLVHQAPQECEVAPDRGIRVRYFRSFADSLAALSSGGYSDLVRVWLERGDRLEFIRHLMKHRTPSRRNHYLWFVLLESPAKRALGMMEGLPTSAGGRLFCVSPRQLRLARRWTRKATLLLPPVPGEFFVRPEDKPMRSTFRVSFLGVLHPDKGIRQVVDLFLALQDDPRFECSIHATHDPAAPAQAALHQWLLGHQGIRYVPMARREWSVALQREVQTVLAGTDVFVHPFQSLQNTVDTPLLVLEAMASLCAVLTTPLGSIPEVLEDSPFLVPRSGFVERATALLKSLDPATLQAERARILERNRRLSFSQAGVVDVFLAATGEGTR